MTANATLIPSTTVTPPPSRIVKEGINLVGPAPSWNSTSLDFDTMLVNQAFVSIEAVGNLTGYTIIISPGLNQPGWAYMKGGPTKEVLPFKGYWLIMDNGPDTLYGFSTTPIPMKY